MKSLKMILVIMSLILMISENKSGAANSNSIIEDDIEYYIQTDKSIYDLGEDVEALYRVTNLKDEDWSITAFFPIMDVLVSEKVEENFFQIWNWSWNQPHPMGPIVLRLQPGEAKELNIIWPQIDLNGSVEIEDHIQVPKGTYRVTGVLVPIDTSVAVDINIIPEPCSLVLFAAGTIGFRLRGPIYFAH